MRASGLGFVVAMTALTACSGEASPVATSTSAEPAATTDVSARTSVAMPPPATETSPVTATSRPLVRTSATVPQSAAKAPASTAPPSARQLEQTGLQLAQRLATAFADGDWDTARQISPEPLWDDTTYEEGFAGLKAATVFLGGVRHEPGRLVMYLLQVAHETRVSGPQTSLYCVRWDLVTPALVIERIAGELVLTDAGFTPPLDAERGASSCDGFDEVPSTPPPAATAQPAWGSPKLSGFNPYDCTFNGRPLHGSVFLASNPAGAELDVYVAQRGESAELIVSLIAFPGADDRCGEWHLVTSALGADFTVFLTMRPEGADLVVSEPTGRLLEAM